MVKNIAGSGSSNPTHLTAVGNTLYFRASDGTNGIELWKSDGTASGTVMVKDINSGSSNSGPDYLTVIGNTLYFRADDGTNGVELWKSDGTESGTVMVKNINSGSGSSIPTYLTAVGNTLYFRAFDGTNGIELWKSDGTASGTAMVQDIYSGSSSSGPAYLTAIGNTLYFSADDGTNGSNCGLLVEAAVQAEAWLTFIGATACTASPNLPTGLNIDSSTCTISGTPTVETVNRTYTVTAVISGVTYQGNVWLSTSPYGTTTSAMEGAALNLGEAMTPITLNYTSQAGTANGSKRSGNETRWTIAEEVSNSPYHVVEAQEVAPNNSGFSHTSISPIGWNTAVVQV